MISNPNGYFYLIENTWILSKSLKQVTPLKLQIETGWFLEMDWPEKRNFFLNPSANFLLD